VVPLRGGASRRFQRSLKPLERVRWLVDPLAELAEPLGARRVPASGAVFRPTQPALDGVSTVPKSGLSTIEGCYLVDSRLFGRLSPLWCAADPQSFISKFVSSGPDYVLEHTGLRLISVDSRLSVSARWLSRRCARLVSPSTDGKRIDPESVALFPHNKCALVVEMHSTVL
jgi:hypothetical protein